MTLLDVERVITVRKRAFALYLACRFVSQSRVDQGSIKGRKVVTVATDIDGRDYYRWSLHQRARVTR